MSVLKVPTQICQHSFVVLLAHRLATALQFSLFIPLKPKELENSTLAFFFIINTGVEGPAHVV